MNEEEKKAIECFKLIKKGLEDNGQDYWTFNVLSPEEIDNILNLIEKQQKEINKLIEDYIVLMNNSIPIFKIKEKINEIQSYTYMSEEEIKMQDYACDRLKELENY